MPKTRAELLAAVEADLYQAGLWHDGVTDAEVTKSCSLRAIACILLAQERRIDEERAVAEPKEVEKR